MLKTAMIVWGIGIVPAIIANVAMLVGSGGYVTRPGVIVRNGLLWPIMLPIVFGMFLQSRGD